MKPLFPILGMLILLAACKKNDNTQLLNQLDQARNWHGYYYAEGYAYGIPGYYPYADTTFALTLVGTNTIQAFGSNFPFDYRDEANQVDYYGTAATFFTYQSGEGVAYFYNKDSIVYCKGDLTGIHSSLFRKVYYTY